MEGVEVADFISTTKALFDNVKNRSNTYGSGERTNDLRDCAEAAYRNEMLRDVLSRPQGHLAGPHHSLHLLDSYLPYRCPERLVPPPPGSQNNWYPEIHSDSVSLEVAERVSLMTITDVYPAFSPSDWMDVTHSLCYRRGQVCQGDPDLWTHSEHMCSFPAFSE